LTKYVSSRADSRNSNNVYHTDIDCPHFPDTHREIQANEQARYDECSFCSGSDSRVPYEKQATPLRTKLERGEVEYDSD